uniref:Uncharacterized protein n=1 Tax=Glossina brevipalpis TaxID=37001 RepID=A0A1A9WUU0_9MUSC
MLNTTKIEKINSSKNVREVVFYDFSFVIIIYSCVYELETRTLTTKSKNRFDINQCSQCLCTCNCICIFKRVCLHTSSGFSDAIVFSFGWSFTMSEFEQLTECVVAIFVLFVLIFFTGAHLMYGRPARFIVCEESANEKSTNNHHQLVKSIHYDRQIGRRTDSQPRSEPTNQSPGKPPYHSVLLQFQADV